MKYMMRWKPSYAIGIASIDEQHKHLFDLAGEAAYLLELPDHIDKYDEIMEIIQALKDYVVYHFGEEEKLLLEMKYSKFFTHRVQHQDFIAEMEKINIHEIDKNQTEELLKITSVVTNWLIEHVLDEDAKWAEYYKEYNNEKEKDENNTSFI